MSRPFRHENHKRPITRRDFLAQGFFFSGAAMIVAPSLFGLFRSPAAHAQAAAQCNLSSAAGRIPFVCFDLAGGANMAGSNVLVGGPGGQLDFLTTAGYSKLGLPGDMTPPVVSAITGQDHVDQTLGLAFHSDSAFLRGMLTNVSGGTATNINGAVIPARSENDTGNNPHNPMYGIARVGAEGSLLGLVGSRNSDSGGNSMAPVMMINAEDRPTKVDRPSDVTGLVDTGALVGLLSQADAVKVLESIQRVSDMKLQRVDTKLVTQDAVIKDLVNCGYVKSADIADRFGDPSSLNPSIDPDIVGPSGIFTQAEYDSDDEFRKTASVMKLVVNGFAGAGTITMGGYDYHGGRRAEGEVKDFRAGRCMGACLEYAARVGVPLMMYVYSDGSLSSNGAVDNTVDGRGKGEWSSDNQSTAASFFLVYNPGGRATLLGGTPALEARHQQLGYFRGDASVETSATPAANNVNLLVETVLLNYMALHGEEGNFATLFPGHGLGSTTLRDSLMAFAPIVPGTI